MAKRKSNFEKQLSTLLDNLPATEEKPYIPEVFILKLTPADVRYFMTLPINDHDRPLKDQRMERLRRNTNFVYLTFNWGLVYCDGMFYRVNGNTSGHMLLGRIEDDEFAEGVPARIEVFHIAQEPDIRMIHNMYDAAYNSRTRREQIEINISYPPETRDIPAYIHDAALGAYYRRTNNFESGTTEEHLMLVNNSEYQKWVNWLYGASVVGGQSKLRSHGFLMAMIDTWRVSPDFAASFWSQVRQGFGEDPLTPTRRLNTWVNERLTDARFQKLTTAQQRKQEYKTSIYLWNKYRTGVKKVVNITFPKNLKAE